MEDMKQGSGEGMDRRSLIKRAGIVGAGVAAWSTPMVTSLAGRAYAVGSPATDCVECGIGGDTCEGQRPCGGGCFCTARADGSGCVCAEPDFCEDLPLCASDADCSDGRVCLTSCCPEPRCQAPCGDGDSPGVRRGGTGAFSAPVKP